MKITSPLSIALLVLLVWLMPMDAFATNTRGDVNNDGEVNIADVNFVIDVILGGNSNLNADVNNDGEVNIADVNTIIDIILGGNTPTPCNIETFTVNGVTFKMVKVEGGTFTMGATEEQGSDANRDEYPTHQVILSNYSIGQTEVTQELWQAVMGANPSKFSGDQNRPVEQVSWDDCQAFIAKLCQITGKFFRLPTEAEWEYAARGGNKSQGYKYVGSNIIDEVAWYSENSSSTTHTVGTTVPNELNLYDMSGNVWEWCQDWYDFYSSETKVDPKGPLSGSYRVYRGGSWVEASNKCRVSVRSYWPAANSFSDLGLRLVLDDDEKYTIFTVNGVSFKMISVLGGTFTMGATEEQDSIAYDDEYPAHQVTLSSFSIGETEVTQALWQAVMGSNPSFYTPNHGYSLNLNRPVEYVDWDDCQLFIDKLNQITGINFRMPTEAEWEYAARGGNKSMGYIYAGSNDVNEVAWWWENIPENIPTPTLSAYCTQPVATRNANELGLYDMSGNVWEWCQDWYSDSYYSNSETVNPPGPITGSRHVRRGGCIAYYPDRCRVSNRNDYGPSPKSAVSGLRLAVSPIGL